MPFTEREVARGVDEVSNEREFQKNIKSILNQTKTTIKVIQKGKRYQW